MTDDYIPIKLRNPEDNAWLGLGDLKKLDIQNPFALYDTDRPGLSVVELMRNPEYLSYAAEVLLGIDLIPDQSVVIEELWTRPFPMFIASRGYGKSFLLAVYATLRCVLVPGTKIVIVGAAFRQSKVIFEYMETIWENSPILKSICSSNSGPKSSPDRCQMDINESWTVAIPLGDGSKIRGLRGHIIIADEFNCLDKATIVETKNGLERIQDVVRAQNAQLINEYGELETPSSYIETPLTDVYEIKTEYGYSFKCSNIHQTKTVDGFKLSKDLKPNDYLLMPNKYEFPTRNSHEDMSTDVAWLLGTLVAEGYVCDKYTFGVVNTDRNLIDRIQNVLLKLDPTLNISIYDREEYIDDRGWKCKKGWDLRVTNLKFREWLYSFGLDYIKVHDKQIPSSILTSTKECVQAFMAGLFEGDGSCFLWDGDKTRLGVTYYSVSEQLCQDVQTLLFKLGVVSFRGSRKSKISDKLQWFVRTNGIHALNTTKLLNIAEWNALADIAHTYIKSDDYSLTFDKSRNKWKVAVLYAGKTRYLGRYADKNEAIKVRDKFLNENLFAVQVKSVNLVGQDKLYDFHLPQTHTFFGNGFIQHNSIPPDIFETVVRGFAAVSAKPVDNVRAAARRKYLQNKGEWNDASENLYSNRASNQVLIAGTAGYDFQPFANYWKRYSEIIKSGGDEHALRAIFGEDGLPNHLNHRDFMIARIPYEIIPEGFMDDKQIAQAKATITNQSIYNMEYGAVFASDSDGFFRRTLIESCVTTHPIKLSSGEVQFDAMIEGHAGRKYVIACDPAAEVDNFSIVILELREDHSRVVYCWTINRKEFQKRRQAGLAEEGDFYGYCARKIRDLMKVFPCEHLAIDAQGGGIAMIEALHDPAKLQHGEVLIWPVIDPDKEQITDVEAGQHIIYPCQFANADWTERANHGLHKDMQDKAILFPRYDAVSLALATDYDERIREHIAKEKTKSMYDMLEDCVLEIEELKNELCTIVMTRTGQGVHSRYRWDTPEYVMSNGKKGRLMKDRYSALVMGNMIARGLKRSPAQPRFGNVGGFAHDLAGQKVANQNLYSGPDWFTKCVGDGTIFRKIKRKS